MLRGIASLLGLAAFIAAAAVGTLALAGVFGTPTFTGLRPDRPPLPVEPGTTTAKQQERTQRPAASIGQTVAAGDVAWTVTDARRSDELPSYTFPRVTKRGSFVSVSFTVENTSGRPVTLHENTATLLDGDGREYPARPDFNVKHVEPAENLLFNEHGLLQPGQKGAGRVNFEVASGASNFSVRLGDTDPTAKGEKRVDLGF